MCRFPEEHTLHTLALYLCTSIFDTVLLVYRVVNEVVHPWQAKLLQRSCSVMMMLCCVSDCVQASTLPLILPSAFITWKFVDDDQCSPVYFTFEGTMMARKERSRIQPAATSTEGEGRLCWMD